MMVIELMEQYVGLFSRSLLIYLIEFAEYPKDLCIELDRIFWKHNEYCYRNMGSTFRNTRFIYSKVSASTLSDKVVQDEEEAESSTQSIRIEESLLGVTPSPAAPKCMRSMISHILTWMIKKNTFKTMFLNKKSPSVLCKNSPMILLL